MGIGFSQRIRWMNWIGGDGSVNAPPLVMTWGDSVFAWDMDLLAWRVAPTE